MPKMTAKEIIKKVKDQKRKEQRSNYTFRLPDELMVSFKKKCESEGISMTSVLEEMIVNLLGG